MCGTYNSERNTSRWVTVIFYSMIYISAINGFLVSLGNLNLVKYDKEYQRRLVNEVTNEKISRRQTKTNLFTDLQRKFNLNQLKEIRLL